MWEELAQLAAELIAAYGVQALLAFLVDRGILPQSVLGETGQPAQEHQPYAIEESVQFIQERLLVGPQSLSGLLDAIHNVTRDVNAHTDQVVGNVQVTWPPDPPSWYTAPPALDGVPDAVWNWLLPSANVNAWIGLAQAYFGAWNVGQAALPYPADPRWGFYVGTGPAEGTRGPAVLVYPTPDWAGVLADDTVLSWLQRTDTSGLVWTDSGRGLGAWATLYDSLSNAVGQVVPLFTEETFDSLRPAPPSPPSILVPPIWPGAANVTLGTLYDLAKTATISEPMDGVLVVISGFPNYSYKYQYDDIPSYRHIGGLSFFDDQGHSETYQGLGFASAIYTPRTMRRAAGVRYFTDHSPVGTIQPWTII